MSDSVLESERLGPRLQAGRARWPLVAGIVLALVVLAGGILGSMMELRRHIRDQIASRDGEVLDAVAAMQYLDDQTSDETLRSLEDPGEQLQLIMKVSRLKNVLGVRLYSPEGEFINAVPARLTEGVLRSADLAQLRTLKQVSHFLPQAMLQEQDLLAETNAVPVPLLEVNIPLREKSQTNLAGVAQFLINGRGIADQYAELDRHLAIEAGGAFLAGAAILVIGLLLAFRQVQRVNGLLAQRTVNLLHANRELALAAKASAVGAVTAHLIHGLKNPLNGLRAFVKDRATDQGDEGASDWQLAVVSTQRMEALINRVVTVLQEQERGIDYEISLSEIAGMLSTKLKPASESMGVRFESQLAAECVMNNRDADLVLLILENLAQNALEATPRNRRVLFRTLALDGRIALEIEDEGPGLSPAVTTQLFSPCLSTKPGGSGIGLAISRQLAKHLGAELDLERTSPAGTVFRLTLPARLAQANAKKEVAFN